VVRNLQMQQGVGPRGLILVSPVLDFREYSGSSILQYVASLPTMTAVARQAKGPVTREDLADVERYAKSDFLLDLIKGQAIPRPPRGWRTSRRLHRHRFCGEPQVGRPFRHRRIPPGVRPQDGKVTGRYDASVEGLDPYPDSSYFHFNDPPAIR